MKLTGWSVAARLMVVVLTASPASAQRIQGPALGGLVESTIVVSDLSDESDITTSQTGTIHGWWRGGASSTTPPVGQNDPRYLSRAGDAYDGVARLLITKNGGTYGCTGALISAFEILTAAHCVFNNSTGTWVADHAVTAGFLKSGATTTRVDVQSAQIVGKSGYTGATLSNDDVAIVRLASAAEDWIPRYSLFSGNPMWRETSIVGFGSTGNGLTGAVLSNQFQEIPVRRVATNRFDTNMHEDGSITINGDLSPATPILLSDFDGAAPGGVYPVRGGSWSATTLADNDLMCNAWAGVLPADLMDDVCHQGYGLFEGLVGPGDSGGPAFVDDGGSLKIAGVASFVSLRCVPSQALPDAQTSSGCATGHVTNPSYFGGYSGHVTVSYGENYDWVVANTTSTVPEPLSLLLFGSGLLGVGGAARRRRARDAGQG